MKITQTNKIVIIIFAIIFGSMIGKLSVGSSSAKSSSLDKLLMKAASEINENCPFMVDENIRVDNAIALSDNTILYNYTVINYLKEEIDIKQIKSNINLRLLNSIKTNPDLKIFRDNKVTMKYTYKDKVGVFLFSLQYKYDDYKE